MRLTIAMEKIYNAIPAVVGTPINKLVKVIFTIIIKIVMKIKSNVRFLIFRS